MYFSTRSVIFLQCNFNRHNSDNLNFSSVKNGCHCRVQNIVLLTYFSAHYFKSSHKINLVVTSKCGKNTQCLTFSSTSMTDYLGVEIDQRILNMFLDDDTELEVSIPKFFKVQELNSVAASYSRAKEFYF